MFPDAGKKRRKQKKDFLDDQDGVAPNNWPPDFISKTRLNFKQIISRSLEKLLKYLKQKINYPRFKLASLCSILFLKWVNCLRVKTAAAAAAAAADDFDAPGICGGARNVDGE